MTGDGVRSGSSGVERSERSADGRAGGFPEGFLWGAATSAYQIEGSPLADGAGASIWHRFSHTPGRTRQGETGDVACDHYRRMEYDLDLMARLGLKAYRFSISWSRVLPDGRSEANAPGLDFYSRLVDGLLARGIEPCATLYHWDLPAALDDRGGWLNPDIAGWFGDYAALLARRLGDRVALWATINEPWVVADAGYLFGVHAPGHANRFEFPLAVHQLLRAHGVGVLALRANGARQVGLVVNLEPKVPASEHPEDLDAAERADHYMNRLFLDPVFRGHYPERLPDLFGEAWPHADSDLSEARVPLDFLGINYYTRSVVRAETGAFPTGARAVPQPQSTCTTTGWEVHPQSLTDLLTWVTSRYGRVPIYITENGAAFYDPPRATGGRISDPLRVDYFRTHLLALRNALEQGVDVRGYFAWSLFDNYEWAEGFSKRFGIVHVDFGTQERTIKESGHYYGRVIATHGAILDGTSND